MINFSESENFFTRFIAVMHSDSDGVIPGNALVVDPKKQFRPLSKFGNAFLNRYRYCLTKLGEFHITLNVAQVPVFWHQLSSIERDLYRRHSWYFKVGDGGVGVDINTWFVVGRSKGQIEDMTSLESWNGLQRGWTGSFCSLMPTSWISVMSSGGLSRL